MRTTININDALLQELKEKAARDKRSIRHTLELVLQRGLACGEETRQVQIEPFPAGVKPAYQGLSMNQLYDQLEGESISMVAEP